MERRWVLGAAVVVLVSAAVSFSFVESADAGDDYPDYSDAFTDVVGVVDALSGIWYLQDLEGETFSFYFGNPGDTPFVGDWDCDGIDTPGLYRQSDGYVYLRNSNTQGVADIHFFFGNPDDIPLVGDFDGDGCDTVSLYRPARQRVYIINELGHDGAGLGAAETFFDFGNPGDQPFVADFNDDGLDTVGVYRHATGWIYYRNSLHEGPSNGSGFFHLNDGWYWRFQRSSFGDPSDQIIAGRWFHISPVGYEGPDQLGAFRPSSGGWFCLSGGAGEATIDCPVSFPYGNQNMTAVAGTFGDLPGNDKMPPTTVGPGTVTEIIDGQTFKVDINGDTHTVRLIGIAAPREGDCYHNEATERLALLLPVGTTNTVLERDTTDVDNDGALLRYATNRIARPLKAVQDHAESMVHGGFARVNPQSPDTSLAEVYQDAEHLAYANDRGLWANC